MGYRVSVWGLWCRGRQQWSSRSQCMVQDVCICVHDVESVRNPGGLLAAALVFTCLCFWRGPMVPASCSTPANIPWNITGRPRITSWSLASATQATHVIPSSLLVPLMWFLRVCLFIVLCRWLHAIAELADRPGSYRHGRRTTLCAIALHRSHLQCISWSQERDTWHVFMHVLSCIIGWFWTRTAASTPWPPRPSCSRSLHRRPFGVLCAYWCYI